MDEPLTVVIDAARNEKRRALLEYMDYLREFRDVPRVHRAAKRASASKRFLRLIARFDFDLGHAP